MLLFSLSYWESKTAYSAGVFVHQKSKFGKEENTRPGTQRTEQSQLSSVAISLKGEEFKVF